MFNVIRARRLELGLTQRELADAVNVGVGTVSRWETGSIAGLRRANREALAKALDLAPEALEPEYGQAVGVLLAGEEERISAEERGVVHAYRALGERDQRVVRLLMRILRRPSPDGVRRGS
jgi:transcriptional regulator with XRE-family HTH domain